MLLQNLLNFKTSVGVYQITVCNKAFSASFAGASTKFHKPGRAPPPNIKQAYEIHGHTTGGFCFSYSRHMGFIFNIRIKHFLLTSDHSNRYT